MNFESVQDAYLRTLVELLEYGNPVTVRGKETKELMSCMFRVSKPEQRVIMPRHRNGNIFAQIAETLWMLAGRNDLDWLEHYIPQCKKFSDDGHTWRAAYGPRLRNWTGYRHNGIWYNDQVAEVIHRLRTDPETRQAVISLWDPSNDNVGGSKDYPCNNWLHFMIREGKLHLSVAVRSNDIMFGFSHADFFGWSVLQNLVAACVGVEVGVMTWYAASMHLYKQHYERAEQIVEWSNVNTGDGTIFTKPRANVYEYNIPALPIFGHDLGQGRHVQLNTIDAILKEIFDIEAVSRRGIPSEAWYWIDNSPYVDQKDFLSVAVQLLVIYNEYRYASSFSKILPDTPTEEHIKHISQRIAMLPSCDLKMAAAEFLHRHIPTFHEHFLERMLTADEKLFFLNEVLG